METYRAISSRSPLIILLDRDGVINAKAVVGRYINTIEEFKFNPATIDALLDLSMAGYQFLVITNQAGIARGITQSPALEDIHEHMKTELASRGINILKIYVCPHHWEDGCDCRKPKPGLIFKAVGDFQLNLSKTIFVGDSTSDEEAAQKAGVAFLRVQSDPQHNWSCEAFDMLRELDNDNN